MPLRACCSGSLTACCARQPDHKVGHCSIWNASALQRMLYHPIARAIQAVQALIDESHT